MASMTGLCLATVLLLVGHIAAFIFDRLEFTLTLLMAYFHKHTIYPNGYRKIHIQIVTKLTTIFQCECISVNL